MIPAKKRRRRGVQAEGGVAEAWVAGDRAWASDFLSLVGAEEMGRMEGGNEEETEEVRTAKIASERKT
jgi:hypothetical protein